MWLIFYRLTLRNTSAQHSTLCWTTLQQTWNFFHSPACTVKPYQRENFVLEIRKWLFFKCPCDSFTQNLTTEDHILYLKEKEYSHELEWNHSTYGHLIAANCHCFSPVVEHNPFLNIEHNQNELTSVLTWVKLLTNVAVFIWRPNDIQVTVSWFVKISGIFAWRWHVIFHLCKSSYFVPSILNILRS